MRYFGKTWNQQWTDLAVVVGPNVRWTEDDFEDLMLERPEVLLGYCVRLAVADRLEQDVQGRRVSKIIVLDARYTRRQREAINRTMYLLGPLGSVKFERWHVHRREGIYQVPSMS